MVCVYCGQKTQVINSRPQLRLNQIWRRRKCLSCKAIFSTHEEVDFGSVWSVKDATGHLSPFIRYRLSISIQNSCQHRPTALSDASALTDTVIHKLLGTSKNGILSSQSIVQVVQVALNRFDRVASVHYRAYHKQ